MKNTNATTGRAIDLTAVEIRILRGMLNRHLEDMPSDTIMRRVFDVLGGIPTSKSPK